jgi:hypothetical protein
MHHIVYHIVQHTHIAIHASLHIYLTQERNQVALGHRRLAGWSGHYYLWACHRAYSVVSDRSRVYEKPASIKEHENEGTERLRIGNTLKLQEASRSEVMVGEVGTMAHEFLAATPFAIHVTMQ